jgi:hypothetical protein
MGEWDHGTKFGPQQDKLNILGLRALYIWVSILRLRATQ